MNKADVIEIRDQIVKAFLPDVMFDGWDRQALMRSAGGLGYDNAMVRAVFPDEILSVLEHFSDMADREMVARLSAVDPSDMRVRERVQLALMARFEYLQAHKETVRESAGFLAWPTRKPRAAKMVWSTADAVWDWAGDESQDYNRYTKRGLLSAIIVPTTLVWLDDEEDTMQVTRDFLGRRIDEVMFVGRGVGAFVQKIKKAV